MFRDNESLSSVAGSDDDVLSLMVKILTIFCTEVLGLVVTTLLYIVEAPAIVLCTRSRNMINIADRLYTYDATIKQQHYTAKHMTPPMPHSYALKFINTIADCTTARNGTYLKKLAAAIVAVTLDYSI